MHAVGRGDKYLRGPNIGKIARRRGSHDEREVQKSN